MTQAVDILTLSTEATASLAAHRFVTKAGGYASAAATALGVTRTSATIGTLVALTAVGTAVLEAGGAIAAGGQIEAGTDGKGVARTTGVVLAVALETATADGDLIEVLLVPGVSPDAQLYPLTATGAIETARFVSAAGAHATAAGSAVGVATAGAAIGEIAPVAMYGPVAVEAGGEITAGAAVEAGTAGKAVVQDAGTTVARALTAAAEDGDVITVLIIPN